MKIKQQNQIKTFLIEEFGVDNSNTLFAKQEKILNEIIKNTKNKSKNQMETLIQTILPRIALYKALKEEFDEEKVYQHMQKYMIDIVAKQKHLSMEKMEKVPCFYLILLFYFHIYTSINYYLSFYTIRQIIINQLPAFNIIFLTIFKTIPTP